LTLQHTENNALFTKNRILMKNYPVLLIVLGAIFLNAFYSEAKAQSSKTWTIEDALLKLTIDQSARIVHLENKTGTHGNVIDHASEGIFKMVARRGGNWEDVVFPEKQTYIIKKTGNYLTITLDKIVTRDAASDVSLEMTIALNDGKLTFDAEIDNRQKDLMITDFVYPQLGVIKTLGAGKPDLLWPNQSGEWCTNIGDMLTSMADTREDPNSKSINYPGNASMQWMSLVDGQQCLYFSGRDAEFYSSVLSVRGSKKDAGAITMTINRLSFVKTNEKWKSPQSIVMLYTGSWRTGADEYVKWASSWRKDVVPTPWVKDMMGYFLVINKQQYGDEMWPYNKLPKLHELAKAHGCDALGLFGWYDSGHDNMYPDIDVSGSLGGASALKDNIQKVQKDGGHVTLYYQGHLIDVTSPYYKSVGNKLESKSIWGVPYYEKYNKASNSEFLRSFTSKTFSTVCPSSTAWHELMTTKAKDIYAFGPNGILYDQIGGMVPNPCFDESHTHYKGKPSLSYTQGRLQLLGKIQAQTKKISPDYAFFTEHITDVYSQFADCLHGIKTSPDSPGSRSKLLDDKSAATINYPELFRYCFPNTVITIRNAFPYITPQFANYAITFGLRLEMELRYLDDVNYVLEDRTPQWRDYASKITALRKKHWDILGHGKFSDEAFLSNDNKKVIAKSFLKGNQLAVVLWNDNTAAENVNLQVKGFTLSSVSTVNGSNKQLPGTIKPQEVLVALYKKNG
jgi:hypothetical protein